MSATVECRIGFDFQEGVEGIYAENYDKHWSIVGFGLAASWWFWEQRVTANII